MKRVIAKSNSEIEFKGVFTKLQHQRNCTNSFQFQSEISPTQRNILVSQSNIGPREV